MGMSAHDRPQNPASKKQASQILTVVLWLLVSLLMELRIGDQNVLCPYVCTYVADFGKASYKIYNLCTHISMHVFMYGNS